MLRVETHESPNSLSLKLEGRFTGDDAENTRTLITHCRDGMRLTVDLTDVTFIDSVGEEVLSFFGRSVRNSLPKHPIHSTYASACIWALLEMEHRIRTRQALPAQTVADARPPHVSRKTRKPETRQVPQLSRCHFYGRRK